MGELGLFGTVIPEEYGGNNMGWLAAAIITEEIARASSSLRVQVNMQEIGCAYTIYRYGTEEQKKKYIQKLVNAEILGAFAITEPQAGSDVMAIKSAGGGQGRPLAPERDEDLDLERHRRRDQHLLCLHGQGAGGKALSAFILELDKFNGITVTDLDKMGSRSSPTGEIILEDTRVPKENILGKPGDGTKIVFGSLAQTRLSAAAGGVGRGAGLPGRGDEVCDGAGAVRSADRPVPDEPGPDRADGLRDRGGAADGLQGGLAEGPGEPGEQRWRWPRRNTWPGELAYKCSQYAMRILGAYGYSTEYPVARYYRDAPTYAMVEGSANICKFIIAQDQLGIRKANR